VLELVFLTKIKKKREERRRGRREEEGGKRERGKGEREFAQIYSSYLLLI
jgi:hypothetical protein